MPPRPAVRLQASVASLQQMAEMIFLEGVGKPKAIVKTGTAPELINELVVNAKNAVGALWQVRGYLKMKPAQRKEKTHAVQCRP